MTNCTHECVLLVIIHSVLKIRLTLLNVLGVRNYGHLGRGVRILSHHFLFGFDPAAPVSWMPVRLLFFHRHSPD